MLADRTLDSQHHSLAEPDSEETYSDFKAWRKTFTVRHSHFSTIYEIFLTLPISLQGLLNMSREVRSIMNDDCWKKYKLMIVAAPKKTLDRLSAAVSCYNRMKNKEDFLDSVSRVYQTWAEAADRAGVLVPVEERGMVF
eukprot:gb/GECG01006743.1/.p1 GENE.gb/GECG01006743.1/~~gb/GECG01006743.1/.p1  ORF type:complete len:139 (+),score=16.95 gb/GECG01006743.1/:1-417(+)